jgi:phosphoglucomutase/phosphomannomutase
MAEIKQLLAQAKQGFATLDVGKQYQEVAVEFLEKWLSDDDFADYQPQIKQMIEAGHWDYLLDCFYQIIPFGTGGRRGEVGIGPNRINPWTIKSSAQGHSQYLLNHYGEEAKTRGVVLAFDVRQFFTNEYFDDNLPNPVRNLDCKDLAVAAAEVYVANGIKIMMFEEVRTTPELSFAIRYKHAVAGDMFSASHNPPEHNGKKVYDEFGGQLIPPDDEALVNEVTQKVTEVRQMPLADAQQQGLIETLGEAVDHAYIEAACAVSCSEARDINIVYTPLHGCGASSVVKCLEHLGFTVNEDPLTSTPSGKFENVTFNIPNPEVIQSFDTPLKFAAEKHADIILNSDPDADRIGIMVKHADEWVFLNGNEIAGILAEYVTQKRKDSLTGQGVMIKTAVTTNLVREVCKHNGFTIIGELLVGYKYIGEEMNKLEKAGEIDNFLFGCEESHGYIAGNYVRDKDAVTPAIWLAELAAELKADGKTLIDFLRITYATYGYFHNYLTEIRLPGAEGKSKIDQIQSALREDKPRQFGKFEVERIEDYLDRKPILSKTDASSKNVIAFHFKPIEGTISIKVTVRPSGTEPKIKMYFEIGSLPFAEQNYQQIRGDIEQIVKELEKDFMTACYEIVGVDFPDRGFLLFWQLPLTAKLKYFEIEAQIAALKEVEDKGQRQQQLNTVLKFLGSDPEAKVDEAFMAKYGSGIVDYLDLK